MHMRHVEEDMANLRVPVATGDRAERRLGKRLPRRDPAALRELYDAARARRRSASCCACSATARRPRTSSSRSSSRPGSAATATTRARGTLLAWLLTIARRPRHRPSAPARPRAARPREHVVLADRAEEGRIDAAARALAARRARSTGCPPRRPTLLRRRFYLEQSQTEIAAATGVPLGTVKTRMIAALRRMRERAGGRGVSDAADYLLGEMEPDRAARFERAMAEPTPTLRAEVERAAPGRHARWSAPGRRAGRARRRRRSPFEAGPRRVAREPVPAAARVAPSPAAAPARPAPARRRRCARSRCSRRASGSACCSTATRRRRRGSC